MGFMEKLKSAFKKKDKKEKPAKAEKPAEATAAAGTRASQFKGEGEVANALRFAASKIDEKMEKGMSETSANIFMGNLKEVEASADPDDAKMVAISQIIGGIINA